MLLVAYSALACSPSLNWREVHLGRMTALLPCKPDNATRTILLDGRTVSMEMVGCEAGNALFAISRVQAADAAGAPQLMANLRRASLEQVQTLAVHASAQSGDAQTSFDVQVDGKRPDGASWQARFKWLLAGAEVYQIAAYAEHLTLEHMEPLISEARVR
jgi:hypothetical protein